MTISKKVPLFYRVLHKTPFPSTPARTAGPPPHAQSQPHAG